MSIPTIKIEEGPEVNYKSINMEVSDEAYIAIVNIGKEIITDSDYFRIGFLDIIKENLGDETTGE